MRRADTGWSNPKVLTILAVIFIAGIACGSAITRSFLHSRMSTLQSDSALGMKVLKDRLQLTPDQEQIVSKELDDYAKYYQNIEEEREDVAEHGKRRILKVLKPEQQKIFLDMFRSRALPTGAASLQQP